jgi:hypothetical protein
MRRKRSLTRFAEYGFWVQVEKASRVFLAHGCFAT